MTSFLKVLRGNGEDAALSEARLLMASIHHERHTLEGLIIQAGQAAKELGGLARPITRMSERLAAVERQMEAIDARGSAVATAQNRAQALIETHGQLEAQLADSGREVARIELELGELGRLVEVATSLKRDLAPFLEPEGPFRVLKREADELKTCQTDLAGRYARLREGQDDVEQTSKQAASRLQDIEGASQAAIRTVEGYRRRVDELEQRIGDLAQLAAGASDTRHQLLTLKSLADQVTQKAAALGNQRDAVERVARDVAHLDDLVHRTDAAIGEQERQMLRLRTLDTEIEDLRTLYESVVARSEEISGRQQEIDTQERATRQQFADLRVELQQAAERFDLEHRGLETVNQRITDLRAGVKECEEHMSRLDASRARATELATRVDGIWNRVGFLMTDVAKIEEQSKSTRTLRADAHRLQELMQDMAARSAEIEKGKPTVDAVARDLGALRGTHEAIKDALERLRVAQDEIARARSSQTETESWLKAVQEPMVELQAGVRQLEVMRPIVESVQKRVDAVAETMEVVAARRQFLDDMQTRLGDLTAVSAQLDDRTKTFRSRLEVAEGRFVLVTRQAEEAERIANLVGDAARRAAEVDTRVTNLGRSVASFEARSKEVAAIAERTRLLGLELEQRQATLDRASEHLTRASALRQEAADAVQQLDQRTQTARTTLDALEDSSKRVEALAAELDGRSGALRSMTKDLAEFEEHLGTWELAKQELRLSLDQVATRQSTVDALKVRFGEMFELAERISSDLRATGELQRDIQQSRPTLEDLLHRLHDADAVTAGLERHKQEIEQAERRLARAEAVLIDIQSSLETLHNQKATLDQVIEKAGALAFQVQQGEALIDRLRKERDITNAVRVALDDSGGRKARPKAG